jgi:ATP-binding cassette subfamily B protein
MPGRQKEMPKAKNAKAAFKRLAKEFKPQLPLIIFISLLLIASSVLYVLEPMIMKTIVNGLTDYVSTSPENTFIIDWGGLSKLFAILFIMVASSNVCSWLSEFIGIKITKTYGYKLDNALKRKLDKLPLSFFDGKSYGDVLSTGVNDVDNIGHNTYGILSQVIQAVVMLLGCIIAMLVVSWQLALIVIASLPVTAAVVVMLIGKRSQIQFKKYRAKYGVLEGQIEEAYNGYKLLKVFNREETAQAKFDAINEEMTEADRKSQWISGFIYPTMRFISQVSFVAVSVGSGLIYADGKSLGVLVAFLMFLNIIGQPFQMLGQISTTFQSVMASTERVLPFSMPRKRCLILRIASQAMINIKGESSLTTFISPILRINHSLKI